jgi:Coenzyme PQQ synthesis protein D (PqqD)
MAVGERRVDRVEVSRPEVVGSVVDGEVVAINLDTGSYYNIAGVGTDVWTAVEGSASVEEVTSRLAHRYNAPIDEIAAAVTRFIDELLAEGLIRPAEADGAHAEPAAGDLPSEDQAAFSPPVLEKFTDMEDLLLLDPVHDVTERGWPHVEAD